MARAGRYAAGSRIEVGGEQALHRACPVQRHAAALINGARSPWRLGVAERAADRRSGVRRRPPPAARRCCAAARWS